MAQQSRISIFDHILIRTYSFNDGTTPQALEKLLHATFETGVVSKNDLPDGYTETINGVYLNEVIRLVESKLCDT